MKNTTLRRLASTAAAVGLMSLSASALAGLVDFTDDTYAGIEGQANTAINGYTFQATFGSMTFNASDSGSACDNPSAPMIAGATFACDGDGIGIRNDEITGNQNETLLIDLPMNTQVLEIALLDLFKEGGSTGEVAEFTIVYEGGDTFTGTINRSSIPASTPANGFYVIDLLDTTTYVAGAGPAYDPTRNVERIQFDAGNDSVSDYAVAGLVVTPLPAAAWLFGSALLGLAGFGRMRRRQQAA